MELGVEFAGGLRLFVGGEVNYLVVVCEEELVGFEFVLADVSVEVEEGGEQEGMFELGGVEGVQSLEDDVDVVGGLDGFNVAGV